MAKSNYDRMLTETARAISGTQLNEIFGGTHRWNTKNLGGKSVEDALWNQGGARYHFETPNGPMEVSFELEERGIVESGESYDVSIHNFDNVGGNTSKIMSTVVDIIRDFVSVVDKVRDDNDGEEELDLKWLQVQVPEGLADEARMLERFGRRNRFRVATKQQRYGLEVTLTK